jgi:hypothetical protein
MQESEMRRQVASVYPGELWAKKVKKMKLGQLYALWIRFTRENKIYQPNPYSGGSSHVPQG